MVPRIMNHVKKDPVGTAAIAAAAVGMGYMVTKLTCSDNRVPNTEAIEKHPLLERSVYEMYARRDVCPKAIEDLIDKIDSYVFYASSCLPNPTVANLNHLTRLIIAIDRMYFVFLNRFVASNPQKMLEIARYYKAAYAYLSDTFQSRIIIKLRDNALIAYRTAAA